MIFFEYKPKQTRIETFNTAFQLKKIVRTYMNVFLLMGTALIFISCTASQRPDLKMPNNKVYNDKDYNDAFKKHQRFVVKGNKVITRTRFTVERGEELIFLASGKIKMKRGKYAVLSKSDEFCAPHQNLKVWLKKSSTSNFVPLDGWTLSQPAVNVNGYEFSKAGRSGELIFGLDDGSIHWTHDRVNEKDYQSNEGEFIVDVFVLKETTKRESALNALKFLASINSSDIAFNLLVKNIEFDLAPKTMVASSVPSDTSPPSIMISSHKTVGEHQITYENQVTIKGRIIDDSSVVGAYLNRKPITISSDGKFEEETNLSIGNNQIFLKATDKRNNVAEKYFTIVRKVKDTIPPAVIITSHEIGEKPISTINNLISIQGSISDNKGIKEVLINNLPIQLDQNSRFNADIMLEHGLNHITLKATDKEYNVTQIPFKVMRIRDPLESLPKSLLGSHYALIIGNNDYQYIGKLQTPIHDAEMINQILKNQFGFKTKLLIDGTRRKILKAFNTLGNKLKPNDSLLVYYAGHGHFNKETQSAYWLPVDAEQSDDINWIMAESLTRKLKIFPSNHVMIVADSCYSGTLTRGIIRRQKNKNNRNIYLKKMLQKPSRTLLASGGNEPVADGGGGGHSIFAKMFIDGLKNMEKSVFTAEELYYEHIKEKVAGNALQIPEYNTIRNSGHDGGDFVFSKMR